MPEWRSNVDLRGILLAKFRYPKRETTIHEIARKSTKEFRDASVISWIVLGRYHHQLFDKAWIARIAFVRKFDIY